MNLPLLTNVDVDAGYIQPPVSWPRPTTAASLYPAWAGEFRSFDDWVSFATTRLAGTPAPSICIDAKGRRCTVGRHFMRARDEDAFPVRFFWDMRPAAELSPAKALPTRDQLVEIIMRETTDEVTADGVPIGRPNILEMGCRYVRHDPKRGYENPADAARLFAGFIAEAVIKAYGAAQ